MAVLLANTFEGTPTETLTAGNSGAGGDAFNAVSGSLTFDDTVTLYGPTSVRKDTGTGGHAGWTTAWGTKTEAYVRCVMRISDTFVSNARLWNALTTGGTLHFGFDCNTSMQLVFKETAAGTVATTSWSLPVGSDFRIEAHCDQTSGTAEVRVWLDPAASGAPDHSLAGVTGDYGSSHDRVNTPGLNATMGGADLWFHEVAAGDDWLGPVGGPAPTGLTVAPEGTGLRASWTSGEAEFVLQRERWTGGGTPP